MSGKTVSVRISQKTCHLPVVTCVCGTTDTEILFTMLLYGNITALFHVVAMPLFCAACLCKRKQRRRGSVYHINDIVVDGHRAVSAICNNTHRFCDNHIQTIYYS